MNRRDKNEDAQGDPIYEIESYLSHLEQLLRRDFTPDQRVVWVTALAERHLWVTETATPPSERRQLAPFQEALQVAWNQVQGQKIPAPEFERLRRLILASEISAPILKQIVSLAIDCCVAQDNLPPVIQAARGDYKAAVKPIPGYPEDVTARKKVWRQPEVKAAIDRQQSLLVHARIPVINEYLVDFLKRDAREPTPFRMQTAFFLLPTHPDEPIEAETDIPVLDLSSLLISVQPGGITGMLASALGKLQQGVFPEELIQRFAESGIEGTGLVTCQTERDHAERLEAAMAPWKNEQRTAFCAALAERWLKVYEDFSVEEGWGHPDQLKRSLDAVWAHLLGRRLSRSTSERLSRQVIENAPDTEDFDAPLAMAACEIIDYTLSSCLEADNLGYATSAGIAACSTLAMVSQGLDYKGDDPDEEERLWQQPAVRQEIELQLDLLARIAPLASMDADKVEALRRNR